MPLSDVAQVKRLAVASEHLAAELGVFGLSQAGVGVDQRDCVTPGLFQKGRVTQKIGHAKRWQAVLPRAEQLAGPTKLEIDLGQPEAIGRRGETLSGRSIASSEFASAKAVQ